MVLLILKILLLIFTSVAMLSIVFIVAAFEQYYLDRKEEERKCTK